MILDEEGVWLNLKEGMSEPEGQAHQNECGGRREAGGESTVRI
jgi:hypothetical protein